MSERLEPIEYGELSILYQDENYVAIDKPSGLLVHRSFLDKHETQFAMQMLRDQIGQHVFPVHRLDRPTSGVLLFALSSEAARDMNHSITVFEDEAAEAERHAKHLEDMGILDAPGRLIEG